MAGLGAANTIENKKMDIYTIKTKTIEKDDHEANKKKMNTQISDPAQAQARGCAKTNMAKELEFVRFTSISQNNGDKYYMWLQWTGNEELLKELSYVIRHNNSDGALLTSEYALADFDGMRNLDDDSSLDVQTIINEMQADTLVMHATEKWGTINHKKVKGKFTVPSRNGLHHWGAIVDNLYLDLVALLFS
jgi:hypothetical protein